MKTAMSFLLAAASLIFFCINLMAEEVLPKNFAFDNDKALNEWQEKIFKNRVLYTVEPVEEDGYLKALSHQASSGLIYKIKIDIHQTPMIQWSWKVTTFPDKGVVSEKGWIEKDDYAARVYVIFYSWNFTNIKTLEYVWDDRDPEETIRTSPYHKNIKLITAQSGEDGLNRWVAEERNIFDDFVRAFGEPPPRYVGAIALMTDADNTLSSAEAFYRDIKVGYKNE